MTIDINYIEEKYRDIVFDELNKLNIHYADSFTHSIDVANKALQLGRQLELSEGELKDLYTASLMHDIGKRYVPVKLLDGKNLTQAEKHRIQVGHIDATKGILEIHGFSENIVNIAYHHHEKLNGTGYPQRLTEKDLSLSDKIIAVADITSALTSKRSYKEVYEFERCKIILLDMVHNDQLDGNIVDLELKNLQADMSTIDSPSG